MLRQDGAMNENPWTRLSRITYARLDHLGIDQGELHAHRGGPSPAWVRRIKTYSGAPSAKSNKALRSLSVALGWPEGTARNLLIEDRSEWPKYMLDDEEDRLIYGDEPPAAPKPDPRAVVREFTERVRTESFDGMNEAEWADLLEAIESKMPHHKEDGRRGKRPQGKTGT
jgi:hypothetical protein